MNDLVTVDELDEYVLSKIDFDYTDLDLTDAELAIIEKYQDEKLVIGVGDWYYWNI